MQCIQNRRLPALWGLFFLVAFPFASAAPGTGERLGLDTAVALAVSSDPWLPGSRHTENALAEEAVAAPR